MELWVLHVSLCCEPTVANIPRDAVNKQMKRTMCKLMWFVVLLQAIQNIQNNVIFCLFFFSSGVATGALTAEKNSSALFHLYNAIRFIRFKWFTKGNCNHQLLDSWYCSHKIQHSREENCYYFTSQRLFLLAHEHLRPKQITWKRHCQLHQNIKRKNEIIIFFFVVCCAKDITLS